MHALQELRNTARARCAALLLLAVLACALCAGCVKTQVRGQQEIAVGGVKHT